MGAAANNNQVALPLAHTPGPWIVKEINNAQVRGALHVYAAGWPGTLVCEDIYGKTLAEADANRALIVASPALLSAALAAVAMLSQPVQYTGTDDAGAASILRADAKAARETLLDAIAKARA